jgi:hypothetical protein
VQHAIEDLDLVQVIALRSEEFAPMVHFRLDNGVVVTFERDLRAGRFEYGSY